MTTQRVECITIPCLRWLGDFDKPKGFRRYGTVFFMRIENISIEDNSKPDDAANSRVRQAAVRRIFQGRPIYEN